PGRRGRRPRAARCRRRRAGTPRRRRRPPRAGRSAPAPASAPRRAARPCRHSGRTGSRRCGLAPGRRAGRPGPPPDGCRARPAAAGCRRRPSACGGRRSRAGRGRRSLERRLRGTVELAPGAGQLETGLLPARTLALDQPTGRERRAGALELAEQLAEPRLRHDRVLVRAEHVLESLGPLDHAPRGLADLGLRELGRVAGALAEDAGPVQLVVARGRAELLGCGAQAPELLARELSQRHLAAPYTRAAGGGLELVEQRAVPVGAQGGG